MAASVMIVTTNTKRRLLSVSLRRIEWLHLHHYQDYSAWQNKLSVSLRRIEWLHPRSCRSSAQLAWLFQYPFVGSNGCITRREPPAPTRCGRLSVSLRRIEWLHPGHSGGASCVAMALSVSLRRIEWLHRRSSSPSSPRPRRRLSVSLRRIEWLHLRDQADAGVDGNQPFSIPSSDRMAASLECDAHWSASHNASFSIPSSDRMAASCVLLRVRGVWHSPFQYPFVGSNGCIIQRHPAVQGEIAELSVSLRRIEWLHRSADCISTCGCGRLSVSLRRIEWLHRTRRTGSTCCRCRLSVSLRRIEWLHPPAGTLPATPSRTLCRSTAPFSCHSQHRLRPLSCSPPAFRRKSQFCASGHPFCEPSCHFPRLGNTWTARPGSPTAPFRPHSAPGSRPGLRH